MSATSKMVTLKNNFHNTEIRVQAKTAALFGYDQPSELTAAQKAAKRRVRRALCGSDTCTCGVVRGPQD